MGWGNNAASGRHLDAALQLQAPPNSVLVIDLRGRHIMAPALQRHTRVRNPCACDGERGERELGERGYRCTHSFFCITADRAWPCNRLARL